MASPPVAYRKPSGTEKTKSGRSIFTLIEEVHASSLPPRLRNTLAAILDFNKFGTELYPATLKISIQAGISYRTAQRHVDKLVEMKVLKLEHEANVYLRGRGFRRSATYTLNLDAIRRRQTWREWQDTLPSVVPIRPDKPAAKKDQAPEPAAAAAPKPRKLPQLTSRQRKELVQGVTWHMKGNTRGEFGTPLAEDHPKYRRPLDQYEAIVETCKELGIPIESAIDALKLAGWTMQNKGNA